MLLYECSHQNYRVWALWGKCLGESEHLDRQKLFWEVPVKQTLLLSFHVTCESIYWTMSLNLLGGVAKPNHILFTFYLCLTTLTDFNTDIPLTVSTDTWAQWTSVSLPSIFCLSDSCGESKVCKVTPKTTKKKKKNLQNPMVTSRLTHVSCAARRSAPVL